MNAETATRATRRNRTDPHRAGAIVPENYDYVLSYNCGSVQDGAPLPSFGVNCELDRKTEHAIGQHNPDGRCCVIGLMHVARVRFSDHGHTGKCTICGAVYVHGDIWMHRPTGEHIHVGHTCSDKYSMLADRGDFDAALASHRQRTAAARLAVENRAERDAFLAEHAGLAEALETDHEIVKDIAARFRQYRSLTEKQIALVMKLAAESANPLPVERNIPAPTGKTTVRGRVVSVKSQETAYGMTMRMTVKVTTDDGTWLCWGTCPESILAVGRDHIGDAARDASTWLRGRDVEFTATLKPGRDAHFAIFSRPTRAGVCGIVVSELRSVDDVESISIPDGCSAQWTHGASLLVLNASGETVRVYRCAAGYDVVDAMRERYAPQ